MNIGFVMNRAGLVFSRQLSVIGYQLGAGWGGWGMLGGLMVVEGVGVLRLRGSSTSWSSRYAQDDRTGQDDR
ncbi:MAG: hypothetical protein WBQ39_02450, partial [Terriglobales bacterium]